MRSVHEVDGDLLELVAERGRVHGDEGRYDPWSDLARRTGVELLWSAQPGTETSPRALGTTNFNELRITLKLGLSETRLRSTLAHELAHLDRGPLSRPATAVRRRADERAADLLAATRVVDPVVFDALMVRYGGEPDPVRVALFLGTDRALFRAYRDWRRSVKPATALRRWARAIMPSAWPAPWMEHYADEWPMAAAFARASS